MPQNIPSCGIFLKGLFMSQALEKLSYYLAFLSLLFSGGFLRHAICSCVLNRSVLHHGHLFGARAGRFYFDDAMPVLVALRQQ
jgi:hypothetical protein